ncbi:hypothetical protein Purlil1_13024 [Purpureocillium lilacinum]|uniref:Uncharacterized protein n=1 Tax=Purpureocillium lilacinum TaxID=33203 RepID=A0ABR0BFC2_PURLI|nr:hypothetical protein Purlil1_13024 [Purpureocillium lilacinum]
MVPFISLDSQAFWHPPAVSVPETAAAKHIHLFEEKRQPVAVRQAPQTSSLLHARQGDSPKPRPWTSIDVISVPSDDESDIGEHVDFDADSSLYEQMAGESESDESLPSISALVASTAAARQDCNEYADLQEDSCEQLDDTEIAGDSDELACPIANRPTPTPDPEAAPQNLISSIFQASSPPISPMLRPVPTPSCQEDEAHQHVDMPDQFALVTSGTQAPASQSPRSTPLLTCQPDHSNRGAEDVHEDDGGFQSDGGLRLVAQSALALPSAVDSSCGASLDCRRPNERETDKHPLMGQSVSRRLCSSTPRSQGRAREPRRNVGVDGQGDSQSDKLGQDKQLRSQGQRSTRTGHNLRPHPSKKRFFGECMDGEDDGHSLASKRRRAAVSASRRRDAQRNSELPRVRGPSRARGEKRGKEDNAGAAAVTDPAHAAIAMYEEWPLSDAILKCVHDNGTSTFQLQFTWATACGARGRGGHHYHTESESGNKGSRSSKRAPRGQVVSRKRTTENLPGTNISKSGLA